MWLAAQKDFRFSVTLVGSRTSSLQSAQTKGGVIYSIPFQAECFFDACRQGGCSGARKVVGFGIVIINQNSSSTDFLKPCCALGLRWLIRIQTRHS